MRQGEDASGKTNKKKAKTMSGTENSIKVLMATMTAAERARLLRDMAAESTPAQEPDRIIRRGEAARLLGRSTRAVDYLVQAGSLSKVTFPGHQRGAGFRLTDIQSLIAGGAA